MKRLIAVSALLAVTTVSAEELKFGDLNYFIKQGQSNVLVDANQVLSKVTSKGGDELLTRGYIFETRYGFGITDQLNLYAGFDYAYKYETQNKTTRSQDIQQDGLSNPLLALNYRALNQNSAPVNFDLGLVARVNVQDAETGSGTGANVEDGNFANGRSSYELNARIGKKWNEANEWQLAAGVVHSTDGEYELMSSAGNTNVDVDSSMDYYVRASYQYRPVNEFMILLSAQGTQVSDVDSKVKSTNTKVTDESHLDFLFRFQARYLVLENMIVKFDLKDGLLSDFDRKTGSTKVEQQKRIFATYGLGVEFLF